MHNRGITHGDLRGVRFQVLRLPSHTQFTQSLGEDPGRRQGPCPFNRPEPGDDSLGADKNRNVAPADR